MTKYILFISLVFVGCATTGKLEEQMQARVGQDINKVITELGPPSSTFKRPDGASIYTWAWNFGTVASPVFNTVYVKQRGCNVSYTAGDNGIITEWSHTGNYCKSK